MHPRRVVVPLVVAALLPWVGGPASAEEMTLVDARGDMWASTVEGTVVPAPGSTLSDLTRARLTHQDDKVAVRLAFVDLAKQGSYAQYVVVLQGSGDRRTREIVLEAGPDRWAGRARVFKPHGDLVANCGVAHGIDYTANFVRLRIARSCLGGPGSVRANVNVYRADDSGVFYSDNPHDELDHSDAWTDWVRRSR